MSSGFPVARRHRLAHHPGMIRDKSAKEPARPRKGVIAVAPPSFRRERALIKRGVWPVAGCDEAGRGPLAGPVVAAAVVLDPKRIPKGIDDSKRLTAGAARGIVRGNLRHRVVRGRLCLAGADRPRQYPARLAVGAGARGACAAGNAATCLRRRPRPASTSPCDCDAVIGGDGLVLSIAAASIIAKVSRDRLMCKLAQDCPGYGFESHKGYGVPEHLEALDRLGPTVHHRRFFAPVAAAREKHQAVSRVDDRRDPSRRNAVIVEVSGLSAGSAAGLSRLPRSAHALYHTAIGQAATPCAFRTFHAFHLPDCRTDPRPAAAGGLGCGAVPGGAVADRCRC